MEEGSQKAAVVVVAVVVAAVAVAVLLLLVLVLVLVLVLLLGINSLKIPKAFLIRSGAQRNFACTFVLTFPTDLPYQIFKLMSS